MEGKHWLTWLKRDLINIVYMLILLKGDLINIIYMSAYETA